METTPVESSAPKPKKLLTIAEIDKEIHLTYKELVAEKDRPTRADLKGKLDELLDERLRLARNAQMKLTK